MEENKTPLPTMPDSYDQVTPTPPTVSTPPTPEPTQPPTQPIPVPEQPNNKISQKLFIPSVVLLLIIAVVLVAFKFIKTKKVTAPQPTPTALTQTTPSPTLDPTANWKTYTDKYFSIKYPSNIDIEQLSTNIDADMTVALKSLRNVSNPPLILTGVKLKIEQSDTYFWVIDNKSKLDLKNWYEKYTYFPGHILQEPYSSSFPNESPKSIDSLKNYQWYLGVTSTDSEAFLSVNNDKVVLVYVNPAITQQKDSLYQILSTFKFLGEPSKCLQVEDPCNPQSCNYDQSKCNK